MIRFEIIIIVFTMLLFSNLGIHQSYGQVIINGTTITTNTATINVTKQLTVDSLVVDTTGITTRSTSGDNLHTYSFDTISSGTYYNVFWTGISSSEIDFSIATMGLSDVRTTTTSPQLGIVQIDNVNTPYSWTGTVNTILVNAGQKIQEFLIPSPSGSSVGSGGGSSPVTQPNPIPTITQNTTQPTTNVSMTCDSGVYDPVTSTCKFGGVNVSIQPATITTKTDSIAYSSIGIQCSGANSLTIQSIDLGFNNLGITLGQIPTTIQCGENIASKCPSGMTLSGVQCTTPITCPLGSSTSNGLCVGQLVCPAGTTQQGNQCVVPATCVDGTLPINNLCQNNGISISVQPTPPAPCDITNLLSCIIPLSSTETASIVGITDSAQTISGKTSITKITNPQMDNTTFTIILLIVAGMIIGPIGIMILLRQKKKPKTKKQAKSGTDKTIKEFNKDVRRNKPDKKTKTINNTKKK